MPVKKPTITLLISCPDRPGIVAAISRFIFMHNGNIVESDQHSTNQGEASFFMRVSFAEEGFQLDEVALKEAFAPIAKEFQMKWSVHYSRQRMRAAIFVSRLDHCLVDLLWRWKSGELLMDIPCIISNHPDMEPLARMYEIPYEYFPVQKQTRRQDQERMLAFLEGKVDFLILARYMQILEPFFVHAYQHRIINIHHSFLPAFVGANPYQRAFERGVKLIGATAHYVTDELDEGPIIAQDVIHCDHRDSTEDLVRKGRDVERRVLAEAVRLHTEARVLVYRNKTLVF
ncbi:formyltetrahydrofolate deformylase [Thermosporothrix hazakensis]|jgi:formyltetrahydrofolate deformylase|uniref:Formyltetrahydrofolate deformylase n=2 Tax=Thermosporothrix TaxID=768650 RepID=A0A326UGF6_THEHA|nr:formyltetrahydrofolate deformylase [Thermosporothrix hazakensis]PZW36060.1 formyltetrahydrofolate deformylase [Thermosporothrix hazakensis]BBH88526.1 formyltetrahydrofolate deformylase [Thermosporothrix sp. COM3]GCE46711.1 formyltetrahydrofolate deformylase [Thermosporothrix hazakensis]